MQSHWGTFYDVRKCKEECCGKKETLGDMGFPRPLEKIELNELENTSLRFDLFGPFVLLTFASFCTNNVKRHGQQ